jgi:hypothetical protein
LIVDAEMDVDLDLVLDLVVDLDVVVVVSSPDEVEDQDQVHVRLLVEHHPLGPPFRSPIGGATLTHHDDPRHCAPDR